MHTCSCSPWRSPQNCGCISAADRQRLDYLTTSQALSLLGLQVGAVSPTLAPGAAPSVAAAPGLTGQYSPAQAPGGLQPQATTAFPWADSAQGPAQPTRLVPSWTPAAIQMPAGPTQVCYTLPSLKASLELLFHIQSGCDAYHQLSK